MTTADPTGASDSAKIFVSYSHADRAWVSNLVRELQGAGLSIWLDAERLRPGTEWDSEIAHALQSTGVLMVVLSPNSVGSKNVLDEINYALNKNHLVVPVLYLPCEAPYRVARLQYIDFTGDDPMALIRLIDYLKAAVAQSAGATSGGLGASGSTVHAGPTPVRRAALSRRAWMLLALPTATLVALGGAAASRRVPARVTFEVVAGRVAFTAAPGPPYNLLNRSGGPFSELRIEECQSVSFSAATFTLPPPAPAPQPRPDSDSIHVRFTCETGSKITLRGVTDTPGLVGVLGDVRIDPGATVVLDVYGGERSPVFTADISTRQQFHVPIHSELEIVADLAELTEPPTPDAVRRSLKSGKVTYRARLPESNRFLDIQTDARTVLVVTPIEQNLKDFFETDAFPVESLQLAGETLDADPVPVSQGKVSYDDLPGVGTIEFSDQFLVLSETKNMYIRSLALDPQGLKLTIGGEVLKGAIVAPKPGAGGGPGSVDLTRPALDSVWRGPVWRKALTLALWLAATLGIWLAVRRPHPRPATTTAPVIH